MNKNITATLILSSAVALSSLSSEAQTASSAQPQSGSGSQSRATAAQSTVKSSRVSEIMDAKIKSKDGQELGSTKDLIVDNASGKIEFLVLGQGGAIVSRDLIPVPWNSVTVRQTADNEREITLQVSKQQLQSAPALQKDYSNLNDPNFARLIREFYASSGMGGSEGPEGLDHGTGHSATNELRDASGGGESPGGVQSGSVGSQSATNWNSLSDTNR